MATYLLQQPKRLDTLALNKLATYFALQAKNLSTRLYQQLSPSQAQTELTRYIAIFRNNLLNSWYYHNALLAKTVEALCRSLSPKPDVQYYFSETKLMLRMIEALFTENITLLALDLYQFHLFQGSFLSKSYLLSGLTHLDLNFTASHSSDKLNIDNDIGSFLMDLKVLKHLNITHICTNNILRCIAKYCKLIEELNVSNSEDINDNSTDLLTQLHHLKSIDLMGTSVTNQGVEKVLLLCTNIEHIGFHSFANVINDIVFSPKLPKLFKIKTYRSINDSSYKLQLMFQACPFIQSLYICATENSNFRFNINNLSKLRELTLENYYMKDDDVLAALRVIGPRLTYLHLVGARDVDIYELMDICSNLTTLKFDECTFLNIAMRRAGLNQLFKNVKKLSLNTSHSFDRQYDQHFFKSLIHVASDLDVNELELPLNMARHLITLQEVSLFLLSHCLDVEFIEMSRSAWLTEDLLLGSLSVNSLEHLKELKICSYPSKCPVRPPLPITAGVLERITRNRNNNSEIILVEYPSNTFIPVIIRSIPENFS